MSGVLASLQTFLNGLPEAFSSKPELAFALLGIMVNAIGFFVGIFHFIRSSKKDRELKQRNNYFDIELESSRIFRVAVQNPDIPRYLRGDLEGTLQGSDPRLVEQSYWFVSQVLNIFEIAISLRNDKNISSELFATWVDWFYELGTFKNFRLFWAENPYALMYNYKHHLQEIMTVAIEYRMSPDYDEDAYRKRFFEQVAAVFKDQEILRQYQITETRNLELASRLAPQ